MSNENYAIACRDNKQKEVHTTRELSFEYLHYPRRVKYSCCPIIIFEDKDLTSCDIRIYMMIFSYANKGKKFFMSRSKLAQKVGVTERHCQKSVAKLEQKKYIIRYKDGNFHCLDIVILSKFDYITCPDKVLNDINFNSTELKVYMVIAWSCRQKRPEYLIKNEQLAKLCGIKVRELQNCLRALINGQAVIKKEYKQKRFLFQNNDYLL